MQFLTSSSQHALLEPTDVASADYHRVTTSSNLTADGNICAQTPPQIVSDHPAPGFYTASHDIFLNKYRVPEQPQRPVYTHRRAINQPPDSSALNSHAQSRAQQHKSPLLDQFSKSRNRIDQQLSARSPTEAVPRIIFHRRAISQPSDSCAHTSHAQSRAQQNSLLLLDPSVDSRNIIDQQFSARSPAETVPRIIHPEQPLPTTRCFGYSSVRESCGRRADISCLSFCFVDRSVVPKVRSGDEGRDRRADCREWPAAGARTATKASRLCGFERESPGRERDKKPAAGSILISAGGWDKPRAGWQDREINEESLRTLDGVEEQGEAQKGAKGSQTVKQKIARLEMRADRPTAAVKPCFVKAGERRSSTRDTPVVYPLHYKRFQRRTSAGSPIRPETPLYRSEPEEHPIIHAPRPTRSIPTIKTPIDGRVPAESAVGRYSASSKHSSPHLTASARFASSGGSPGADRRPLSITPASFLHGTIDNCVRHGRRSQQASKDVKKPTGTRDMVTKGRSGAYVPSGLTTRRQMEATSPWIVPAKHLIAADDDRRRTGGEACPDCVQELGIKRREMIRASAETVKRPSEDQQVPARNLPALNSAAVAALPIKMNQMNQNFDAKDRKPGGEPRIVSSADLGAELDAVIVQRKGNLQQIVVNARNAGPVAQLFQRFSEELAKVSQTLASQGMGTIPVPTKGAHETSTGTTVILHASTPTDRTRNARYSSVPELLELIDRAASEIHRNSNEIADIFDHDLSSIGDVHPGKSAVAEITDPSQTIDSPPRKVQELTAMSRVHLEPVQSSVQQPWPATPPKASPRVETVVRSTETSISKSNQDNVPTILKTRPTLRLGSPEISYKSVLPASTSEETQPVRPSDAGSSSPSQSIVSTTRTLDDIHSETPHRRGFLQTYLNPFHHSRRYSPQQQPAHIQASPHISSNPNPYHHAPSAPRDLYYGEWTDPKVREQKKTVRAALRVDRDRALQEAAAVEKEVRRKKSEATAAEAKAHRIWL